MTFLFPLQEWARAWLQFLPANSIKSWAKLIAVFLVRNFSPSKTSQVRSEINNFRQEDMKSLFNAWDRYNNLLRLCPFHGSDKWLLIHSFYKCLIFSTRMNLDTTVGGTLMNNLQDVSYNLIKNMEKIHHSWGNARERSVKAPQKGGLYEVSQFYHMNAKVDMLY